MNKKSKFFVAILTLTATSALAFPGCASDTQPQTSQTSSVEGQEIYGKITAINGNEITLKIGTLRQPQTPPREQGDKAAQNAPEGAASDALPQDASALTEEQTPSQNGQPPEARRQGGGRKGSGESPEGAPTEGGPGGGRQGAPGGQNTRGVRLDYTGEESTWLIPVSASITAGESDSATEVRFTQLAVNNIVCLTVKADDSNAILSVRVLQ